MPNNNFLPFCPTDTGTNLLTQGDYAVATDRDTGNQPGVASSKLVNKAIRQATFIAAQIAQYMVDTLGADVLDDSDDAALLAQIKSAFRPAGEVTMWGGAAAPAGWHLLDGSSLLRATYPALFAVLGTTYGAADGTHFTLPDARGSFIRGAGAQTIGGIVYTGTRGTTAGDTMQGHWHANAASGSKEFIYNRGGSGILASTSAGSVWDRTTQPIGDPSTDGVNGTPRTGAETAPANITLSYIIKLG